MQGATVNRTISTDDDLPLPARRSALADSIRAAIGDDIPGLNALARVITDTYSGAVEVRGWMVSWRYISGGKGAGHLVSVESRP
jgi:hypothetical protein